MWSVSDARTYRRCPRQWYYKHLVASATAKDEFRRKVHLLSKLQSVSAWRGQIVDDVISQLVVERLRQRQKVTLDEAKRLAQQRFQSELAYAIQHAKSNGDSHSGSDFVALHALHYQGSIAQEELDVARREIDQALTSLFGMDPLKSDLKTASLLLPQRMLVFEHSGASVRAVPDLIAFFHERAPLIVDWKVHTFGIREAWLQLAVYAMALTRCKPHKDFPNGLTQFSATDIELVEAQLLTGMIRRYRLEPDELERAELYIAESISEIDAAVDGRKREELNEEDFGTTSYSATCQSCSYREVCWRTT